MRKKSLALTLMMAFSWLLGGGDLMAATEIDGIYYNLYGTAYNPNYYAQVTYNSSSYNSYSGDVVIPSSIEYNNITYPVTQIGASAFRNCTGLTSVSIPEGITSIGDYAFYGCNNSSFRSITLPSTVTSIASSNTGRAFYNCTYLESINIPSGVTNIPQYSFYGCAALSSVNIPSGVTTITTYAFRGCSSLTSILLPASITSIESNAFYLCTNLASVTLLGDTPPSLHNAAVFQRSYTSGDYPTNFYVLKGSGDTYKSADYWSTYSSRISELTSISFDNLDLTNSVTALTIPSGVVLTVTGTLINTDATKLVIQDGGQLIIPSSKTDVKATFQKEITGYEDTKDNYFLIANPTTGSINPTTVSGMLDNNYDLYYFDEAQSGAEWRNYKQEVFNLVNGKGYLYANSSNLTLEFPGTVLPGTTANITLSKSGSGTYNGFNLVGNPLSNNVTSMKIGESSCSYYKVNSSTGVFAASEADIIVGEAFMVEAPSDEATLTLNPSAKDEAGFTNEVIRLEVSNSKFTDVAYVYFGNHLPLTKINHLNDEAPMLYIHNENSDKAVEVYNNRGEVKSINVNFEAKTIGTYTISAKMVKGEIKYMHLYDRFTGIDTDLLIDDYSFIGANEDQPGRFILKLEAIDNEFEGSDNFAYQSGNNIMVNGEGELQIFDVMGRMVMNERINSVESISGLSRGIYIFRVIGETQKTQKIVVR